MSYENSLDIVLPTDAQNGKMATVADALLRLSEAMSGFRMVDLTADAALTKDQVQRAAVLVCNNVAAARVLTLAAVKRFLFVWSPAANSANVTLALGTATAVIAPGTAVMILLDGTANGLVAVSLAGGDAGGGGTAPAGHKCWRVLCTGDNGNGIGLAEVQFRTASGMSSVPSGGTPLSANDLGGGYSKENAYDGNSNTFWASSSTNSGTIQTYIGYQFAGPIDCVEVALTKRPAGYGDSGPTSFKVQYADDAAGPWTSIVTDYVVPDVSDGGGWPPSTTKVFSVP